MPDGKRRVLLVDDEPSILKTVGKRLELNGYEVATAADGEEALAKAQAQRPDVIILDLMLPRLSGFDVCARLKQDQHCQDIPVVVMFTGKGGGEEDQARAQAAGAAAFVTKQQGTPALLAQIEAFLSKSGP